MLVHWVRHAESEANQKALEDPDTGLSPLGLEQASRLARRLESSPPGVIFSSPFRRALETARPVAEAFGLPVCVRGELAEFHADFLPALETHPRTTLAELRRHYRFVEADPERPEIRWPRWPESLEELVRRQQSFVAELKARWGESPETLLLVSHGSPTARAVEAWLTDEPGPGFRFVVGNATLNTLRYRGGRSSLLCFNESSHLVGLPTPPWESYFPPAERSEAEDLP